MQLKEIDWKECISPALATMPGPGLLLTTGIEGNPITVGWLSFGVSWGVPIVQVMVRPSRYSFGLMEGCKDFVLNIPQEGMKRELGICGSKSGRDIDKIKECGFSLNKSSHVIVPNINESSIHLECRTVHTNDVINSSLETNFAQKFYPSGDFHKVYWGKILGAFSHIRE